jgi:hypothetical protein
MGWRMEDLVVVYSKLEIKMKLNSTQLDGVLGWESHSSSGFGHREL